MLWNNHWKLEGQHAYLGASKHHWINYDETKLRRNFTNQLKAKEGTELHEIAKLLIQKKIKLRQNNLTFNSYVNDAIGFGMDPEVPLAYNVDRLGNSDFFGTPDAMCFRVFPDEGPVPPNPRSEDWNPLGSHGAVEGLRRTLLPRVRKALQGEAAQRQDHPANLPERCHRGGVRKPRRDHPDHGLGTEGRQDHQRDEGGERCVSDEFKHYGIMRRSGRYPWGSGDTEYARSMQFYDYLDKIREKNPGIAEKDLAKLIGEATPDKGSFSVANLRDTTTIAKEQKTLYETMEAKKLKAKDWSVQAISENLGISVGTVNLRLKASEEDKKSSLRNTAEMLRKTSTTMTSLTSARVLRINSGSVLNAFALPLRYFAMRATAPTTFPSLSLEQRTSQTSWSWSSRMSLSVRLAK